MVYALTLVVCFTFVERAGALYLLTICELNMTKLEQNPFL
ncbi:hypothetical protein GPAL_1349 [Glaciecola pallidula DSM 14239 = ACAM 615]|uniref:Uncharacterized protein n=1 Tax=Brumicola pallidula DSM 14239 = ACAM 615 TaxID=1121922 RepID=K6ZCZ5_9ALTE|nr:hypothetical protein GPAL_1349 [Glaciecola pallidula DSM 14239 = ACAM 615]